MGDVGVGRVQRGAVGLQLLRQARDLLFRVADLRLRSGRARVELGAALFVGAAALSRAIEGQRPRVEALTVLLRLAFYAIAALRAFAVLTLHLLHGVATDPQLFANLGELPVKGGRFGIQR